MMRKTVYTKITLSIWLRFAGIFTLLVFLGNNLFGQCTAVIGSNIDPLEGCEVLTIQFYDQSSNVLTRTWDFGDGSAVSVAQNPVHSFNAGQGDTTYTVTLSITCASGTSQATETVVVYAKPDIDFQSDKSSVCAITDSICLTNLSDYHPSNTYTWNFGDGTISSLIEPCKTFSTPGLYTTTLTVINEHGCLDTRVKEDFISVEPVPSTAFTVSQFSGCSPFTVTFRNITDTIGNDYSNWTWDFGDGSPKVYNPAAEPHTYTDPGEYVVTLGVTNSLGCYNYSTQIITVHPSPVASFFTSSPDCHNESTTIQFNGSFNSSPVFNWDFDSAVFVNGSGEGPYEIRWQNAGIKGVSLTVEEDGCSSSFAQEVQVNPIAKVYLHISASADTICSGETVVFTASPVNFVNYSFYLNNSIEQSSVSNSWVGTGLNDGDRIYVKITDVSGCTEIISDTIDVSVRETPVVTLASSAANDTICIGTPVAFTASPAGFEQYNFFLNNEEVQNSALNTLSLATLGDEDRVYVKALNFDCESSKSNTISTIVKEKLPAPEVNCGATTPATMEFIWDPVPGAAEYEISIDNSAYFTPSTGSLGLSHEMTGLTANETHTIKVRANDGSFCGIGLVSDEVTCESKSCDPILYTLINPTRDVCEGETVKLSIGAVSVPNYSVSWNAEPGTSQLSYILPATSSLVVPVVVSNLSEPTCPPVTKKFKINVTERKDIVLQTSAGSASICEDEPVLFTVSPANLDSYTFYDNGLELQTGFDNDFINEEVKSGHKYFASAVDEACFLFTDTVTINVDRQLTIPTVNYESSTENSITFTWNSIPGATGYSVSINNGPFIIPSSGLTGLTHTVSSLRPGDAATIAVLALGDNSCGNSYLSQPAVGYAENCIAPGFELETDYSICRGDSLKLEIKDLDTPDYQIFWGFSSGSRNKSLWVNPVKDTTLSVIVKNTLQPNCPGVVKYLTINVADRPVPLILSSNDADNQICQGSDLRIFANPGGYDQYEFYNRSLLLVSDVYNTYDIKGIGEDYDLYARAVNQGCSGPLSNVVEARVIEPLKTPQVNCGTTTASTISFLWDSIPSATGYMISLDELNYSVPSTGLSGLSHEVTGLSGGDSLTITVMALGTEDCNNSLISATKTCYAQDCDAITFSVDPYYDICENETVQLTVYDIGVTDYSIQWNGGAYGPDSTIDHTGISDTVITVKMRDNSQPLCPVTERSFEIAVRNIVPVTLSSNTSGNLVCEGEGVVLTALPAGFDSYAIYNGTSLLQDSISNTLDVDLVPADNEYFAEVYQDGCYSITPLLNVTVQSPPELFLTASRSGDICDNTSVEFTATGGFASYYFMNSDAEIMNSTQESVFIQIRDTIVTVNAVDGNGCKSVSQDTIHFNIQSLPSVFISSSEDTICFGEYVNYFALPDGMASYEFFVDANLAVTTTDNIYATDSLEIGEKVSLVGIDGNGCRSLPVTSAFPYIHPYPEAGIIASDSGLCFSDTVLLVMDKDPVFSPVTYYWSTGETSDTIRISPAFSSIYELYYSDPVCKNKRLDSKLILVDRDPPPVAWAGIDTVICIYDSIQLEASGGLRYEWSPSSGLDDSTIFNPFAKPVETTLYVVKVTNQFCYSTDTVRVLVDLCLADLPDPVPQIITPNDDGINDYWEIPHVDYFENNRLEIYNRWGNLVYSASPYYNDWNGKSNKGVDLPDGTYFYVLNLGNEAVPHTGYIIIHR